VYLNVDLEIRSQSDLTPLVQALRRRLFVLHAGRMRGTFFASFETPGASYPPDIAIRRLASALLRLPPPLRKQWRQARDRVFDIGIARAAGATPFSLALRNETMRIVTELNARLALTLYPHTREAPRRLPNTPRERSGTKRRRDGTRRHAATRRRGVRFVGVR
jgi:hypothetical protein